MMAAQDDAREKKIIDLFNLKRPPGHVRHGTDAVLHLQGQAIEFELKSVTTKGRSLSTVRDFGPDHIKKWKNKHWLVGVFSSEQLVYCLYGSPADMAAWIEQKWEYIKADFELGRQVPTLITEEVMHLILGKKDVYDEKDAKALHKNQYSKKKYRDLMDVEHPGKNGKVEKIGYSPSQMLVILKDLAQYVLERGATLNNPHISKSYTARWKKITEDHAISLRQLVQAWLDAKQPQADVPLPAQPDIPLEEQQSSQ